MYDKFHRFSGIPFQLRPDGRFFFGSSGHSRAFAHMIYGRAQEEGFIVITGEVGAGKTTLVEQLWSQLDRQKYLLARIVKTQVSDDDLLRLPAAGFGVQYDVGTDKATLLRRLESLASDQLATGRRCLLVVDEVQDLAISALEELRILSNITADGRASMQTILLGQPQFRTALANAELEQLRQRVLASFHLGPLTDAETHAYRHRLRCVGWTDDPGWDDAAFACVYPHTSGIPRRINTLCSRLVLYASIEEAHTITGPMVETTANELANDLGAGSVPAPAATSFAPTATVSNETLVRRIEALEAGIDRQDRVFRALVTC